MLRVLAIDPGERAGWAHADVHPDEPDPVAAVQVTGHGISFLKDLGLKVLDVASEYDVVIYETYRISPAKLRQHAGSDVPTLQLIGIIRAACWRAPNVVIRSQGPSVKATADKVIPRLYPHIAELIAKAPAAHDDSHDCDALRHLAFYHFDKFVN